MKFMMCGSNWFCIFFTVFFLSFLPASLNNFHIAHDTIIDFLFLFIVSRQKYSVLKFYTSLQIAMNYCLPRAVLESASYYNFWRILISFLLYKKTFEQHLVKLLLFFTMLPKISFLLHLRLRFFSLPSPVHDQLADQRTDLYEIQNKQLFFPNDYSVD